MTSHYKHVTISMNVSPVWKSSTDPKYQPMHVSMKTKRRCGGSTELN